MVRKQGLLREHGSGVATIARVLDAAVILAAALLAYELRFDIREVFAYAAPAEYVACTLGGLLLGILALHVSGVYSSWRGAHLLTILRRVGLAWAAAFATLIVVLVLIHMGEYYSRLWLGYWFVAGMIGLVLIRVGIFLVLRTLRARGWHRRNVVIFGAGELGMQALRTIRQAEWAGYEVVALFDDDPAREGDDIDGVPVRTDTDGLAAALQQYDAGELWIALPLQAEDRVRELLHALRHTTVNIRLIPDIFSLRLLNYSVTDLAGMTVLNLASSPMTGFNRFVKAVEDRVLALVMLVVLSPLLLGIALAIRVTMGPPVLFSQMRCGWDGRPIRVYKFRSMCPDADQGGWVTQARPDDPRVTRVGRFLRRTSLDELPQLWNVLRGDMSIVGPRPHALEHDEYYKQEIDDYMRRHKVKPGITGWAQVSGLRGETRTVEEMRQRIEYDLYYIENWSVWFDLQIIANTAVRIFSDPRAY